MSRIVVPLDGTPLSERAVRPAVSLAVRLGAEVVLLGARPGPDDTVVDGADRADLDDLAAIFTDIVRVGVRVVDVAAVDAVVQAVDEGGPGSLVCMATHGRGELGRLAMGSTAESVIQRTNVPVILIGSKCRSWPIVGERARVILCSDGSAASEVLVPMATGLLERGNSTVWAVEVVPPDENVVIPGDPAADHPRENTEVAAALERLGELRERLLSSGIPSERVEIRAAHGEDVARAVEHLADQIHASLIAVATHGRTGVRRVALGSVAIGIVREAPCPVLVVRADRE